MNPISHPQIGRSTHKEYEARYGNHSVSSKIRQEAGSRVGSPLGRNRLALAALSGLSIIGVLVALL